MLIFRNSGHNINLNFLLDIFCSEIDKILEFIIY